MALNKVIVLFCCVLVAASLAYAKGWHGITPLRSTRADVEKQLGPAKDPTKEHVSMHETENEEVIVEYSTGPPCGTGWPGVWRVPRGTVINIIVHPKREVRFADLHLDEGQYKETDNEGHGPPYFYYTNKPDGIQYEVTQGRVMSITYFANQKDSTDLRCSERSDGSSIQSVNSSQCQTSPSPTQNKPEDVRAVDFKNFTYPWSLSFLQPRMSENFAMASAK